MADLATNKQLVEQFYDAFTSQDLARLRAMLAADWRNHPADPGRPDTVEGFLAGVGDFHAAFEEYRIARDALVAEDDLVVCRITMSGRHVGEFAGHARSGREVTFHGMDMHRISGQAIAETWHFERLEELDS